MTDMSYVIFSTLVILLWITNLSVSNDISWTGWIQQLNFFVSLIIALNLSTLMTVSRLAMVQFGLGSGTFWLNPNLEFNVWSWRLANLNPEPRFGPNL